ncbi:hypothetical protein QX776_10950 [Alteromonadaceae bacterium BrNp21-10]|nr:hypothetical protein [Alteromonadaceae bacterium BrNp21-10]
MKLIVGCLMWVCSSLSAATLFTYNGAETDADERYQYVQQVLQLALEVTKEDYGEFQLVPIVQGINKGRLLRQLELGVYKNIFVRASVTDDMLERFHVIHFPIDLGTSGYRVALINQVNKHKYCGTKRLKALHQSTIIQGIGWLDTDILTKNGFKIFPISNYDQMFDMIDRNRVDLFFRSINEIDSEIQDRRYEFPNVIVESCVLLHYPLPRFLITHKDNIENAKRVEEGLIRAFKEGHFQAIWRQHFASGLKYLQQNQREVIELDNPYIQNIDPQYRQYNADILVQ